MNSIKKQAKKRGFTTRLTEYKNETGHNTSVPKKIKVYYDDTYDFLIGCKDINNENCIKVYHNFNIKRSLELFVDSYNKRNNKLAVFFNIKGD